MKIIGLTGGIASGKSTVSSMLQGLGAAVIDADIVARKIVAKGQPALQDIVAYFGKEVLLESGELNRKMLGSIVFKDATALKKLNEITHDRITEEIQKEINWYKKYQPHRVIIIDAALLIETDLKDAVDEIWLVTIPKDQQKFRLMERDRLTALEAEGRMIAQMPMEEKLSYADKLINNQGSYEDLEKQVKKLWGMIEKT
ncbi:dephospho-CoA kinase [Clostridium formicaceticum]|uniref:Dephospho-CoA kinase n=1 Tax=Clostridium formicaceticum TaxID=1497 RepID=A0AAC9RJD1_9CLOT|nr:dephospho-CoA kinase [Clostridium formicaceticum]AOY76711.1 dephospho-CoA kinase [Clostridium formicaceticum]ARE87146.1 Dephospho-CoA kinase [Clostridium formicaceticum]